jgi:hypothetical protein
VRMLRISRDATLLWVVTIMSVGIGGSRFIAAPQDTGAVNAVGSFISGELGTSHTFGYEVRLWRQQDQLLGFLIVSGGLSTEPPVGVISTVQYNAQTGEVEFDAKIPIDMGETCERFRFAGRLLSTELVGTLEWVDPPRQGAEPGVESLHLKRSGSLSSFPTYQAWQVNVNERLKLQAGCP